MTTPAPSNGTGPATEHACSRCDARYTRPLPPSGLCWECERRDRDAAEWREKARKAAGVPARFERFRSWGELRGPDAYMRCIAAVERFAEHGDSVLAMIGTRGTGKTQAAAVAIWQSIDAGRSAKYTTALQLLADLKGRYGGDGSAEADWLAEWTTPYLLCIDEIAERLDTPHAAVMLTALVDARYGKLRPTLLVGNVTPERFAECVGGSIADRCNEGGGIVRFDKWPSFRKGEAT